MIHLTTSRRHVARDIARAGTLLSVAMLVFTLAAGHKSVSAVAENAGAVILVTPPGSTVPGAPLTSGASATIFAMAPPSGASCPGSATGTTPYRWQTFMVASSVDPAALTFATGPNSVGSAFVGPMYDSVGNPINNKNPSASPLGLISGIPTMSFGAFTPGMVPAGDYKVGFACTTAGATVKFWSTTITVTTAAGDSPAGFTWSIGGSVSTTTTVGQATTTSAAGATTTTAAGATTTAGGGATTTTVKSGAATTTLAGGGGTTTTLLGSGSVTTTTVKFSTLPGTGSESMSLWVWALLAIVFGRMALLLGRSIKVL